MAKIQFNGKSIQIGGLTLIIPPVIEFSDWFLPSFDELSEMYTELHLEGVGGFTTNLYWSSSEFDFDSDTFSTTINFLNGNQNGSFKSDALYVRACRSFTGGVGEYSLRDTGPAGGLIFYINGTTYYEAAPSDQSTSYIWSNINSTEIGTTGTSIGTGQQNTLDIIGQVGFTDGAAKLCNDLVI